MERVSQTMMSRMFLQDMYGSLNRMLDVEQQLSSGQVYSKPSDNPSEVVRGMALESTLVANEQYVRNLDDAITRLANTETAFGQITDCISAIREDAVQACSPGLAPVDREAIAQEIEALREEIIQAANYSVEGVHLLSGNDTTHAAFGVADDGSVIYQGDRGHISFEVEQGAHGQVSLNGRDVFPVDYERRSISSVEVPMDFRWSGSSETLQFRVGDRTADVTFPERWSDDNGDNIPDDSDFDGFRSPGDQVDGYSLREITDLINASLEDGGAGNLVKATVETDSTSGTQTLTIQSLSGESLQVTSFPQADNNDRGQWAASLEPEFVAPATAWKAPSNGEIKVSFSGGESHMVSVSADQTITQVASALSSLPGLWAGVRGNGIALVAEGETEPFTVTTSGGAGELFVQPVCESGPIEGNHDLSHTGLASLLGLQTAVTSTEVPSSGSDPDHYSLGDMTQPNDVLDMKFVSGSYSAELKIDDDPDLTVEEFAQRLRGVAGDWLEVIVETDEKNQGFPLIDKSGNTYYPTKDVENSTQRLVLRTYDGTPLNIYDVAGSGDHAAQLGIGTAQASIDGSVSLPGDVTPERPARIGVEVGGELFEVKLFSDQISSDGSTVNMDSVARQILEQVGSDTISADISDDNKSFALFSSNGEPVRVVDLPYADFEMNGMSSGLAAAMGLQSGVTGGGVAVATTPGAAGTFSLSSGARSLEISVAGTDTLGVVADKIREQAGSWLDVSISENAIGEQQLSLSAKDGSAVNIYDITGDAARTFELNTDVRATGSWSDGDTLDITVDGYTHGIDLTGVTTFEGVADLVNVRFPGMDVRAKALDADGNGVGDALTFYSPRGKTIALMGPTTGTMTFSEAVMDPNTGLPIANTGSTEARGGTGPNGQNVVVRTGANVEPLDLFGVIADLASAVRQGDVEGISNSLLPDLDRGLDDVLQARSYCGALEVRYKAGRTRLTDDKVALTGLYSRVMDVDMAEAAMEFQTSQAIYQATLAAMSKVIQPTLVDYLT